MKEKEFLDWLIKSGQQDNSAKSVLSRVKRVEEAYPDLDLRIEDNSIETLLTVFDYTKQDEAQKRSPLHKIEINGDPYTGTQSLRNAIIQYVKFRQAYIGNTPQLTDSKTTYSHSYSYPTASDNIFKIDVFHRWMTKQGRLKDNTADSYIAYLKALGKFLSQKSDGFSNMGFLYKSLREENISLAFEILDKVDEVLTELLSSSIPSHKKKVINNWRSAERKYFDFLKAYF